MSDLLDREDIKFLKGIGEVRAKALASEADIRSFRDLLYYFPYKYVDRSRFYAISDLSSTLPYVQIKGRFTHFALEGEGSRQRLIAAFSDGRNVMEVVWFSKLKSIRNSYTVGQEYILFGKPNYFNGSFSMIHPEVEKYNPEKKPIGLQGIYPISEKMRRKGITSRIFPTALSSLFSNPVFNALKETLPSELLRGLNLPSLGDTFRQLHFPTNTGLLERARLRMKFEELFYLELNILRYASSRAEKIAGHVLPRVGDKFNGFYKEILPFNLTEAQKRVLREIHSDMISGRQMNRLLQGDVGSGKTIVAFMTMLLAVDNGFQASLMAPTEILATQHYESLRDWCGALGIEIRLLTGSTSAKTRREIDSMLRDGSLHILVGTHALLEEKVTYKNLGVAVIDEQHRFGVAQRAKMWLKNQVPPHMLIMTATPIPRTLAMTVYGDLDVSVINELPPGRKPIQTWLRYDDNRMEINRLISSQLREGRQVYIVYPLVHENEKLNLKSVEQGFERIAGIFKDVEVCCVHGQLSAEKKEKEMQKFVSGEAKIMVATTVIEVGVNVPNASVMIIENAERFGLSQLHQLRGRVGRGAELSYCVLVSHHKISTDTKKRLSIMTETTDGFLISEADMKLRGPGDMEGTQQSGLAVNLKIADLAKDGQIVQMARDCAKRILEEFPHLYFQESANPNPILCNESLEIIRIEMQKRFSKTMDWSQIS